MFSVRAFLVPAVPVVVKTVAMLSPVPAKRGCLHRGQGRMAVTLNSSHKFLLALRSLLFLHTSLAFSTHRFPEHPFSQTHFKHRSSFKRSSTHTFKHLPVLIMRSQAVELAGLSLFIFNLVNTLPAQPKEKPEYIPAGTGLTYPPEDAESSSELTSLMKKINNWDTPLLEGNCSPYPDMKGIKVEPDNADAFQDSEEFHVRCTQSPD